jgi:hypothetical protein
VPFFHPGYTVKIGHPCTGKSVQQSAIAILKIKNWGSRLFERKYMDFLSLLQPAKMAFFGSALDPLGASSFNR